MATRHVRAVQKRNGDYEDRTDFMIMQVIATDIGYNDEPCNTSYRTIADRTGVHYNTVSDHIKKLIAQGHLIGKRKGKYIYYSLPFHCDNQKTLSQRQSGRGDNVDYDNLVTLSQFEERLSQFEQAIVTKLENIITMHQTGTVTKVSKDKESIYIDKDAQEYPSLETEFQRMDIRTAILTQVKETMYFDNEDRFNSCADSLIEMGATPEEVKGFGAWWKDNGQYKGKPALKSFMQNYKSYRDGETFSKNDQHKKAEKEIPSQGLKEIRPGVY